MSNEDNREEPLTHTHHEMTPEDFGHYAQVIEVARKQPLISPSTWQMLVIVIMLSFGLLFTVGGFIANNDRAELGSNLSRAEACVTARVLAIAQPDRAENIDRILAECYLFNNVPEEMPDITVVITPNTTIQELPSSTTSG